MLRWQFQTILSTCSRYQQVRQQMLLDWSVQDDHPAQQYVHQSWTDYALRDRVQYWWKIPASTKREGYRLWLRWDLMCRSCFQYLKNSSFSEMLLNVIWERKCWACKSGWLKKLCCSNDVDVPLNLQFELSICFVASSWKTSALVTPESTHLPIVSLTNWP